MAVCIDCEREMTEADSCTVTAFHRGRQRYEHTPFGHERPRARAVRCPDCNVARGGFHHPGCDMQVCPACRGQLIGCRCLFDEWGDEYDEEWDEDAEPLTLDERIERTIDLAVSWTGHRATSA